MSRILVNEDYNATANAKLLSKDRGFRYGYVGVLNQTISGIETLSCFRNLKAHDQLIKIIEAKIRSAKSKLDDIQARMDGGTFSFNDYLGLINDYSYQYFTGDFFNTLKIKISDSIDFLNDMSDLDTYDFELIDFCDRNGLPSHQAFFILEAVLSYRRLLLFFVFYPYVYNHIAHFSHHRTDL